MSSASFSRKCTRSMSRMVCLMLCVWHHSIANLISCQFQLSLNLMVTTLNGTPESRNASTTICESSPPLNMTNGISFAVSYISRAVSMHSSFHDNGCLVSLPYSTKNLSCSDSLRTNGTPLYPQMKESLCVTLLRLFVGN